MTAPDDTNVTRGISVSGIRLRFAASHMATLGSILEPLHGHNYLVSCHVEGNLTADNWVMDFSVLKKLVRTECELLDHKFLLQMNSSQLAIEYEKESDSYIIGHSDRIYKIPAEDVIALPIENSTAELIAEHIADGVVAGIVSRGVKNLTSITVEVEEMPGQSGIYTCGLPDDGNDR